MSYAPLTARTHLRIHEREARPRRQKQVRRLPGATHGRPVQRCLLCDAVARVHLGARLEQQLRGVHQRKPAARQPTKRGPKVVPSARRARASAWNKPAASGQGGGRRWRTEGMRGRVGVRAWCSEPTLRSRASRAFAAPGRAAGSLPSAPLARPGLGRVPGTGEQPRQRPGAGVAHGSGGGTIGRPERTSAALALGLARASACRSLGLAPAARARLRPRRAINCRGLRLGARERPLQGRQRRAARTCTTSARLFSAAHCSAR